MADDDLLASILAHVGELLERGEQVDIDSLVRDHPDLEGRLRKAIAAERLLGAAFPAAAPSVPQVPDEIGPYRVLSRLGGGGMGTVYLAETRQAVVGCEPGEHVALKVLHPHLLERPGFFKRFLREADAGRRIEHPHVVRTLDADAVRAGGDTVHFLVMEYVEGRTLADLLKDLERVPETLLREIARQMAEGLAAIHAGHLVHRDVKPENALITSDHIVRLMDLGIARPLAADDVLTQEGAFAGSLPYAAPEQFGGVDVGPAADLYALGVTLYELATGVNPFRRDDLASVMAAHREHVPMPVGDLVEDASPFFSELVATLLAKQPEARLASAGELAAVLAEGERSQWWREREAARPRGRRLPVIPVRRETALQGREADLAALRSAWERALGGHGRVLLLEGEAGIGKSRLVDAFLRELADADVHVLYGSYPPVGGSGGISDALVANFGEHCLADALAPYVTASPALVPLFAAYLRHEPPPDGAAPLNRDAIHAIFQRLLEAMAAEKPVVWIVEDLHFADEDSRALVMSLARAAGSRRVLLVATTRPGLSEEWLAHVGRLEATERRGLSRLSPREVIHLLQEAFRSDALADKLGARIALKSDGVPFFVFEMIRGLREGQFITVLPDGTHVETRVVDRIEVPSAVRGLLEARLRDLSRDQRALLDVGAVQGFTFDPVLTARVLGRSPLAVLQDLADLERHAGLVHGERGACRFDHHQMQEILYGSIPPDLRIAYHAAVANALGARVEGAEGEPGGAICVALCRHFLEADLGPQAVRFLSAAQSHLDATYRFAELTALTERVLALPDLLEGRQRVSALLSVVESLRRPGLRGEHQLVRAREAERLAAELGDDWLSVRAAHELGGVHLRAHRLADAEAAYRRELDLARKLGRRRAEAVANSNLAIVAELSGRLGDAHAACVLGAEFARETGDRALEAAALDGLGRVYRLQGEHERSLEHHTQAVELYREIDTPDREAVAMLNVGVALMELGHTAEAVDRYEHALTLARATALPRIEASTIGNLGIVHHDMGRLTAARRSQERHLALARELGDRNGEALGLLNLGQVLCGLGETSASEECWVAGLQLCAEIGAHRWQAKAHLYLGALRESAGDIRSASKSLVAARDLADRAGNVGVQVLARCRLAALLGGDVSEALDFSREHAGRLSADERRRATFLLWRATGGREHLAEAKRLLDRAVGAIPAEDRDSMLTNVRVNREIVAAWNEHCAESAGESETRAG